MLNMIPSARPSSSERASGDFLKLDYDFSFTRNGLEVSTVLFDKSTDKSRSENIFTAIFGKLMEWRAKQWVQHYVEKNTRAFPGSVEFLKNINSSKGVYRSDFMELLIAAKINNSPVLSFPLRNTRGLEENYSIQNLGEKIINFVSNLMSPSPGEDAVKVFFEFLYNGSLALNRGNLTHALNFIESFRQWSEKDEKSEFFSKIKGSVNLFHHSVLEKINQFKLESNQSDIPNIKKIHSMDEDTYKNFEAAKDKLVSILNSDKIYFYDRSADSESNSGPLIHFERYVTRGSAAINFTTYGDFKNWSNPIFFENFINGLPTESIKTLMKFFYEKIKVDIEIFESDSFKKKIDVPDFLNT